MEKSPNIFSAANESTQFLPETGIVLANDGIGRNAGPFRSKQNVLGSDMMKQHYFHEKSPRITLLNRDGEINPDSFNAILTRK